MKQTLLLCMLLCTGIISFASAQDIESKLSGNTTVQGFTVRNNSGASLFTIRGDGKTGIGAATPELKLTMDGDGGILAKGTYGSGNSLTTSGAGTRLIWYPKKAAFRAGSTAGTEWDDANIGNYSVATGWQTTASGGNSTAMGVYTTASGDASTAMGFSSQAGGLYSTAMGSGSIASAIATTALGSSSTASGGFSTAIGVNTTASGDYSLAMGSYVSTFNKTGACILGDRSTTTVMNSSADNQMTMRFAGGYRLYSSYTAPSTGVYMNASTSGWTNYSDRNRKENFTPVNGELLLEKIRDLPVTEWNYKNTDASIRYIGPMAQDFWQAFHLSGTDSLGINSIAIDGVNMAAIKALEERTMELRKKTEEIASLKERVQKLEARIASLNELHARLSALERLLAAQTDASQQGQASLDITR